MNSAVITNNPDFKRYYKKEKDLSAITHSRGTNKRFEWGKSSPAAVLTLSLEAQNLLKEAKPSKSGWLS